MTTTKKPIPFGLLISILRGSDVQNESNKRKLQGYLSN